MAGPSELSWKVAEWSESSGVDSRRRRSCFDDGLGRIRPMLIWEAVLKKKDQNKVGCLDGRIDGR